MELKNIVYGNLIAILQRLTSNDEEFENYYNALDSEQKRNDFFQISEDIDNELNKLIRSKLDGRIHPDFSDLSTLLETFLLQFQNYPSQRINEALVIIYLINSLSEALDEGYSLEDNHPIENFELVELSKEIQQRNFAYYDNTDLTNSIVLIDFSNTSRTAEYFSENSLPKELIIQLLIFIGRPAQILNRKQYTLCNKSIETKPNQIWSIICTHIVKNGKIIHQPYNYTNSPVINPLRKIRQSVGYQQFDDSIMILSEYNYQQDILDKYLRIYHLIENFMYKYPLAQLERKYVGNVFSMRDFQRMNDALKNNEITSIKNLIKVVCTKEYQPGKTFSEYILETWIGLNPGIIADKNRIDVLLSLLRIDNDFDSINHVDKIPNFFSTMIYAFRNSLVHNRETEFHLTHEALLYHNTTYNTAQLVLENFLIPLIEEVVFYLIIEPNNLVWFLNPTLKLYNEN